MVVMDTPIPDIRAAEASLTEAALCAWLGAAAPGDTLTYHRGALARQVCPQLACLPAEERVALARAFAPNPRLIFADEPTGNLDAATGHQIIDLMFAINAERGTTLILVTHDEEIAARCGRRLRMHAGEIAEVVND